MGRQVQARPIPWWAVKHPPALSSWLQRMFSPPSNGMTWNFVFLLASTRSTVDSCLISSTNEKGKIAWQCVICLSVWRRESLMRHHVYKTDTHDCDSWFVFRLNALENAKKAICIVGLQEREVTRLSDVTEVIHRAVVCLFVCLFVFDRSLS